MQAAVLPQVGSLPEVLTTIQAGKRTFSSVNALVQLQTERCDKCFSASAALMGSDSGMPLLVSGNSSLAGETLAADVTFKWSLTCME